MTQKELGISDTAMSWINAMVKHGASHPTTVALHKEVEKEFEEVKKVMGTPDEDLPLLIGLFEKKYSQEILERKLKEGGNHQLPYMVKKCMRVIARHNDSNL